MAGPGRQGLLPLVFSVADLLLSWRPPVLPPPAAALKPMGWARFLAPLSADERANPLLSYYARLLSPDANVHTEAVSVGRMGKGWLVGRGGKEGTL